MGVREGRDEGASDAVDPPATAARQNERLAFTQNAAFTPPAPVADARQLTRTTGAPSRIAGTADAGRSAWRRAWQGSGQRLRRRLAEAVETEAAFGQGFLWFAVAFAAGAAFWRSLPSDPSLAAVLSILAFCVLGTVLCGWRSIGLRSTFAIAATIAAGLLAAELESLRRSTIVLDGPVVTWVSGTVAAREIDEAGHWRYTIDIDATADPVIRRPPERVRILARSFHPPIAIGQGISGRARLSPPSGPAMPDSFDFSFNAYFSGIGAFGFFYGPPAGLGMQREAGIAERTKQHVRELRETIAFRIREVIEGDAGAIAAAMTVSDRRAISEATNEAFRTTGLAHILAISGLHMALAAGIMFGGLRGVLALFPGVVQSFAAKKVAALGAIVTSTSYLVISGAVVSAQRAWIMVMIMFIAVLLDRQALTMRNVALAAIVILAITPSAVTSPGFQMSFAATAALIASYGAWQNRRERRGPLADAGRRGWLGRPLLWIAGLAMTSLIAGLATGIFTAHHFHRMSGHGLIANVAVMPIITALVMPAALFAILLMPFGLDRAPLKLMEFGLDGVLAIAHRIAALGGDFITGLVPPAVTLLLTAALVIFVLTRTLALRLVALVPMAAALLHLVVGKPAPPDLLIAEDGRLVGLLRSDGLATNRRRPSAFIFDQWTVATRRPGHVAPVIDKPDPGSDHDDPRIMRAEITAGMEKASGIEGFACQDKAWCVGRLPGGDFVATVEDPAYIGAACDLAAIVVTHVPLRMAACRSGGRLFTPRTLRNTGAVALHTRDPGRQGSAAASEPAEAHMPPRGDFDARYRIETALGDAYRPWTIHRYYDWRSGTFEPPSGSR
jgi:competence protein ComEC